MKEKIVIYDNNPIVLTGLQGVLTHKGYEVLDCKGDPHCFFQKVASIKPDFIIIDPILMAEQDITQFSQITHFHRAMKVIIFASSESVFYILRSHGIRWNAYISKNQPVDALINALQVTEGNGHDSTHRALLNDESGVLRDIEALNHLTGREMQVLREIGAGKSNKTIATELQLSNKTISTYKRSIMEKFNTGDMREVLDFARRHGF